MQEETLFEKVAAAAGFLLCIVSIVLLGSIL